MQLDHSRGSEGDQPVAEEAGLEDGVEGGGDGETGVGGEGEVGVAGAAGHTHQAAAGGRGRRYRLESAAHTVVPDHRLAALHHLVRGAVGNNQAGRGRDEGVAGAGGEAGSLTQWDRSSSQPIRRGCEM